LENDIRITVHVYKIKRFLTTELICIWHVLFKTSFTCCRGVEYESNLKW